MKEEKRSRSPFAREHRAAPIEKYNSRSDRRTSQNGAMAFSAFVFVVAFCAASLIGVALAGEPVAEGTVASVDAFGRLVLRAPDGSCVPVASGEAHLV